MQLTRQEMIAIGTTVMQLWRKSQWDLNLQKVQDLSVV